MTLRELSQLYWLNREIEYDQERLRELEGRAYGVGGAAANGIPRASEAGRKTERYALELESMREIIQAKKNDCITERRRLETYISSIDDSLTRLIFTLRFVNGLPWAQIAASIGGRNTEEGVKKICYRYLRKHT